MCVNGGGHGGSRVGCVQLGRGTGFRHKKGARENAEKVKRRGRRKVGLAQELSVRMCSTFYGECGTLSQDMISVKRFGKFAMCEW